MQKTKYNIPDRLMKDITAAAEKHGVERVILFGSRARGCHSERSDIDLAIHGGSFNGFYSDIKENSHSLLMFDIINLDKNISAQLNDEIKRVGVKIYEKA